MMTSYIYLVVVIVIATFSSESHGIPVHNTRKTTLLDQPLNVLQVSCNKSRALAGISIGKIF